MARGDAVLFEDRFNDFRVRHAAKRTAVKDQSSSVPLVVKDHFLGYESKCFFVHELESRPAVFPDVFR